jgi:hypothetical protein
VREKISKRKAQLPPKPDWVKPASAMCLGNSPLVQQVLHQPPKGVPIKKYPSERISNTHKYIRYSKKRLTPEDWERLRLNAKNSHNQNDPSKDSAMTIRSSSTVQRVLNQKKDDTECKGVLIRNIVRYSNKNPEKPKSSYPTKIDVQNPSEYSEKISSPDQGKVLRKSKADFYTERFQEFKESGTLPAGTKFGVFAKLNIDDGSTADEVLAQLGAVRARSNEAVTKSDDFEGQAPAHNLGVGAAETQLQDSTQSIDPSKASVLEEATTAS